MWTLYRRALLSYFKLWKMTLLGPAVTKLLYLAVFGLATGSALVSIGGMPMPDYIVPGLVVLGMALGAFQHPAYMILHDKMEGVIADELMAPMQAWERTLAHLATGVTTGLAAGAAIWLLFALVIPMRLHDPLAVLAFGALGSLMMGCIGALTGIFCVKWDQLAAIETFLVMPLVFLSGTFFARADIPEPGRSLIGYNPMFFAIDGVRYGMTGIAQIDLWLGAAVLLMVGLGLSVLVHWLFRIGFRTRS